MSADNVNLWQGGGDGSRKRTSQDRCGPLIPAPSGRVQDNDAVKAGLAKYVKKKKLERLDS